MDWREAAASGLPAPRDDEPASLRQDILDELADRLDCALRRELIKNLTQEEAVENVKRRFGNPRDLARRLWLDSMKDTIMSKRLTLAAMGLMAVTCLLFVWMAWTSQRASQQAAESIRKTNAELVEKLTSLLAARPTPGDRVVERVPVHFDLVCDDAKKSPAVGYRGTFALQGGGSSLNALRGTSDETGTLRFGELPAGSYFLTIFTPWEETTRIPFNLSPGFPITSPIVCPARDWQPADVAFEFAGLPSLKDRDALIICHIAASMTRRVGNGEFAWNHEPSKSPSDEFDVVLDSTGRIIDFAPGVAGNPQQSGNFRSGLQVCWKGYSGQCVQRLAGTEQLSWLADNLKSPLPADFHDRKYEFQWMAVVLASDIRRLAGQSLEQARLPRTFLTWNSGWTPVAFEQRAGAVRNLAPFQPIAGQRNVWKLQLQADLAQRVDEMLVASASLIPAPKNEAEAKTDATAGAELRKTLGIDATTSDHTAEGLSGLRLKSIRHDFPAGQAGVRVGDLLVGIEGWNVNDDRELGWASRADRPRMPSVVPIPNTPADVPRVAQKATLFALVRRGSETRLFEIPLTGTWQPPSSASAKEVGKSSAASRATIGGARSHGGGSAPK